MKLAVALALLPAAAAFVGPAASAAPATKVCETKADMEVLAKQLNPAVGFWDPLGCLNFDFWQLGQEGTIGYLRHAEIKHGRARSRRGDVSDESRRRRGGGRGSSAENEVAAPPRLRAGSSDARRRKRH